jgi:hypothetical protein
MLLHARRRVLLLLLGRPAHQAGCRALGGCGCADPARLIALQGLHCAVMGRERIALVCVERDGC